MKLKLIVVALLALGIGQTAAWGGGAPRTEMEGPTNASKDETAVKRAVAEEALRAGFPP